MLEQWLKELLTAKARSLRFSLFPPVCLLCRQPGQHRLDLCAGCQANLVTMGPCCGRCAEPLAQSGSLCGRCHQQLPVFDNVFAPYLYSPPVTRLITAFKFQRQHSAGHALGILLSKAVKEALRSGQLSSPDCLIPVPLHPWRQISRGFNQAQILARDISRQLDSGPDRLPVSSQLLQRVRKTQPQPGLKLAERRRNLKGVFKMIGKPPPQVALVDDVMTSGSTVNECARVLKKAGCKTVQVWVLARAERPA